MTFDQFLDIVAARHRSYDGAQRYGQTFYNVLVEYRDDISIQLLGSIHDPFYRDVIPGDTFYFVKDRW